MLKLPIDNSMNDVLSKIHAPPKDGQVPLISHEDLTAADGFIFGLPTRYGIAPAQFKSFWDSTGQLWQKLRKVH